MRILEVFQHYFEQLPQPMCDTQVMANFLGFTGSAGFATLVQHYFHIEIDKGASRTDWLARPLSEDTVTICRCGCMVLIAFICTNADTTGNKPNGKVR